VDRLKKLTIDIKREISFIINVELKDPRIGFVTITGTKLSADCKFLNVYLSIMGKEEDRSSSLKILKGCGGFIKRKISGRIRLRNIPDLRFIYDDSIDRGMRISKILETINKEGKDSGSQY
jgi:ribosome-binding factor A